MADKDVPEVPPLAERPAGGDMSIGESFVGTGPNAAHVNVVLGGRDGPVATAWATALATPSDGHAPFVAVMQPGLPVKPFTLFVNKARIEGAAHGRITWGPAQAGVAAGVADAVAAGVVPEDEAEHLLCIAAVWVDPAADEPDAVFANNREATRSAIVIGRAGLPAARDAVAKRTEPWNPYYRPASPPAPE
jgi:5,6,7,8-tetrahydromethanopterin hydro-lyase